MILAGSEAPCPSSEENFEIPIVSACGGVHRNRRLRAPIVKQRSPRTRPAPPYTIGHHVASSTSWQRDALAFPEDLRSSCVICIAPRQRSPRGLEVASSPRQSARVPYRRPHAHVEAPAPLHKSQRRSHRRPHRRRRTTTPQGARPRRKAHDHALKCPTTCFARARSVSPPRFRNRGATPRRIK